jgi:hypothetical protein
VSVPWRCLAGKGGASDALRSLPPARTRQCVRVTDVTVRKMRGRSAYSALIFASHTDLIARDAVTGRSVSIPVARSSAPGRKGKPARSQIAPRYQRSFAPASVKPSSTISR